jgi:hypothetical protein
MKDNFDLNERPDAAQLEATRAEIIAFREQNRTLGTAALAIAFIEKRGTATSTELSVLLGLAADEYPSVVLRSSVQGERLACVGRVWTLGPKAIPSTREQDQVTADNVRGLPHELVGQLSKPAQNLAAQAKPEALESGAELWRGEKPTSANFPGDDVKAMAARRNESRTKVKPDALESGAELGKREPEPLDVPRFSEKDAGKPLQELKQALREPAPPTAPSKTTRCRFAVWSDGKVEIAFPSLPSVVLSSEEFKDLVRFVGTLP